MGSDTECAFTPAKTSCVPIAGREDLFPVHRVYCVALNYRKHVREMGGSLREPPFFFSKPADAVCTDPTIPFPAMTAKLQHEVELVVALSGGGMNIPPDQARSLVFGYAVGVDLTRRDLQTEAKNLRRPWTTAKGFDHSAPVSVIRPVSDCGHPDNAPIELSVNGHSRQQGNVNEMTWSVPEVIAELSRYFELKAGDLIFTGTPSGVGDLLPGDRVDCTIGNLGSLAFRMEASRAL